MTLDSKKLESKFPCELEAMNTVYIAKMKVARGLNLMGQCTRCQLGRF